MSLVLCLSPEVVKYFMMEGSNSGNYISVKGAEILIVHALKGLWGWRSIALINLNSMYTSCNFPILCHHSPSGLRPRLVHVHTHTHPSGRCSGLAM